MPHDYTLVVKAKDCLFLFKFDFCGDQGLVSMLQLKKFRSHLIL